MASSFFFFSANLSFIFHSSPVLLFGFGVLLFFPFSPVKFNFFPCFEMFLEFLEVHDPLQIIATESNDNYVNYSLRSHFVLSPAAPLELLFIPRSRSTTGCPGTFWICRPLCVYYLSVEAFSSNLSSGWLRKKRDDGELFFPPLLVPSLNFLPGFIPGLLSPSAPSPTSPLPPADPTAPEDEFSIPKPHSHCVSFACAPCQGDFL